MNQSICLLLERDSVRLYRNAELMDSFDSCFGQDELVESIAKATSKLANESVGSHQLTLAIGSDCVLCLDHQPSSPGTQSPTTIKFELEQHLPVDAEQMAICEVKLAEQNLVVVFDRSSVKRLIDELNNNFGIEFSIIFVATPRLLEYLLDQKTIEKNSRLIVINGAKTELIELHESEIASWNHFAVGENPVHGIDEFLSQSIDGSADNSELCVIGDMKSTNSATVSSLKDSGAQFLKDDYSTLVAKSVANVDANHFDSKFDLTKQVNPSSSLVNSLTKGWEHLAFSLMILFLCIAGSLAYQARQWSKETGNLDCKTEQEFRKRFPGSRINGPINRILESKLAQVQEENKLVAHSSHSARVLRNLASLLRAVPNMEYRFSRIVLKPDFVKIEGEVDDRSLVKELERKLIAAGFEVKPFDYEKNFSITIKLKDDTMQATVDTAKGRP